MFQKTINQRDFCNFFNNVEDHSFFSPNVVCYRSCTLAEIFENPQFWAWKDLKFLHVWTYNFPRQPLQAAIKALGETYLTI
jgi:hypothetical protein